MGILCFIIIVCVILLIIVIASMFKPKKNQYERKRAEEQQTDTVDQEWNKERPIEYDKCKYDKIAKNRMSIKCPNCGKLLTEMELTQGKCFSCGLLFERSTLSPEVEIDSSDNNINNNDSNGYSNGVGATLHVIGVIVIIVGFIAGMVAGNDSYKAGGLIFLMYLSISVVTGMLIYGIGEIIQLLQSINDKLDKK